MTGPDSPRVTLWMMKSTQLVSPLEQNVAENCPGDEVMLLSMRTVRTSSPRTFQVMTLHSPSTVALNRTSEPCSTAEVSGSRLNCCNTTNHRQTIWKEWEMGFIVYSSRNWHKYMWLLLLQHRTLSCFLVVLSRAGLDIFWWGAHTGTHTQTGLAHFENEFKAVT